MEFILAASLGPVECNRKEGLGERRARPADCVPMVFKGGDLTALCCLYFCWCLKQPFHGLV